MKEECNCIKVPLKEEYDYLNVIDKAKVLPMKLKPSTKTQNYQVMNSNFLVVVYCILDGARQKHLEKCFEIIESKTGLFCCLVEQENP